jgi:sodium/proline symporter
VSPILVGFVVYLLVVLGVGLFAFARTSTQSGFLLADRKLGPWVIALSERASGESAWLLVGLPGAVMAAGMLEMWTAVGCCTGILFSWTFVATRLRKEVGRTGSMTLPDFFRARYPETHEAIRIVSSLIITFFFTFYVAAQFNGAGKVLDTTFGDLLLRMQGGLEGLGLSLETTTIGILIGVIIVLFYTTMGGFLAVAWTDFVQGLIMVFTCVVLPVVAFVKLGGSKELLPRIHAESPDLLSMTGGRHGLDALLGVIGGLSWGLGYMGQPHLLTRFMAIRRPSDIRKGMLIAAWWAVPAFWGAGLIGIIGLGAYGSGFFEDPETLMPFMAQQIMPGWLAGIMISGAIAAMMSTADSQLLVTTSTLSEDVYHKMLKRKSTPEQLARFSRIATVVVGAAAFVLAMYSSNVVFTMVSFAWSGLAAAFAPQLVLTLWWKKTTGLGVLVGMIGGTLAVIVWRLLPFALTERVGGVLVATILIVVVSLWDRRAHESA